MDIFDIETIQALASIAKRLPVRLHGKQPFTTNRCGGIVEVLDADGALVLAVRENHYDQLCEQGEL